MVRKKNLKGQGKVSAFYFESGKIQILKKSQGKIIIKIIEIIEIIKMPSREGRLCRGGGGHWRLLVYVTFCVYLVRDFTFIIVMSVATMLLHVQIMGRV